MAYKNICDICGKKEADTQYKIKRSTRGMWLSGNGYSKWDETIWQPYKKISVCSKCGEILFNKERDKNAN